MNGPTDRSNDFCKTFGSYFRQAAEAQKKLVEITMSKVSPDSKVSPKGVPGFTMSKVSPDSPGVPGFTRIQRRSDKGSSIRCPL
jgi:hypothetical protein